MIICTDLKNLSKLHWKSFRTIFEICQYWSTKISQKLVSNTFVYFWKNHRCSSVTVKRVILFWINLWQKKYRTMIRTRKLTCFPFFAPTCATPFRVDNRSPKFSQKSDLSRLCDQIINVGCSCVFVGVYLYNSVINFILFAG